MTMRILLLRKVCKGNLPNSRRTLVTDPKYGFLRQLGLTTENHGVFDGRWGGSGKVCFCLLIFKFEWIFCLLWTRYGDSLAVDWVHLTCKRESHCKGSRSHTWRSEQCYNWVEKSLAAMGFVSGTNERRNCSTNWRRTAKELEASGPIGVLGNGYFCLIFHSENW